MPARQLCFWPPPGPLVERFGEEFFQQLPSAPAVYLFCGPSEGILYVGKAKNLRRRLAAYRVANPERLPRRLIRLLHQVTRIEWDLCTSEAAAVHREAELIAALNPRFNRAGTAWPGRVPKSPVSHRSTPGGTIPLLRPHLPPKLPPSSSD